MAPAGTLGPHSCARNFGGAFSFSDEPESEPEELEEAADARDVDLLLTWKTYYADGDLGFWTRGHIDDVLLDHLPRTVSASPKEVEDFPRSVAAFMRFLGDQGPARRRQ